MDDNEHRGDRPSGSSGDGSGAVSDPRRPTDVKASRADFNGRKPV